MREPGSVFLSSVSLPNRVADGVGSGEKKVAFTTSLQPVLSSVVHDAVNLTSVHLGHFFLPDFSERFPPRSDFSDRSPFSLSFSISFSLSLSALSMRSARSERSAPLSDLLSALLPSRRVPSSVEEVVGWGWPRLAISSCSEILVVMLFTHAFRSSYAKWLSTDVSWMTVISSHSFCKLLTDFWQEENNIRHIIRMEFLTSSLAWNKNSLPSFVLEWEQKILKTVHEIWCSNKEETFWFN